MFALGELKYFWSLYWGPTILGNYDLEVQDNHNSGICSEVFAILLLSCRPRGATARRGVGGFVLRLRGLLACRRRKDLRVRNLKTRWNNSSI